MRSIENLQREIENARRKLDDAIGEGCDEALCYRLSIELDALIEQYINVDDFEDTELPEADWDALDIIDVNTEYLWCRK